MFILVLVLSVLTGCVNTDTNGITKSGTEVNTNSEIDSGNLEEDPNLEVDTENGASDNDYNVENSGEALSESAVDLDDDETELASAEVVDEKAVDSEGNEQTEASEGGSDTVETEGTIPASAPNEGETSIGEPQEIDPSAIPVVDRTEDLVVKEITNAIPENMILNRKYDKYQIPMDYVVCLRSAVNIRQKPTTETDVVKELHIYEKIELVSIVKGEYFVKSDSDEWYKVKWTEDGVDKFGYIYSKIVSKRTYQFEKMTQELLDLDKQLEGETVGFVNNYKNYNGRPPLYKGAGYDNYGIKGSQSAPAYSLPNRSSTFRYVLDGTLVLVKEEIDGYYKVEVTGMDGEYYIPKRYVPMDRPVDKMTKAIIVDVTNQNEAVFELIDGQWNMISYIYATTGADSEYKEPTIVGKYKAIEKRKQFLYLDDITKEISGYAPHVIRFNGGAYVHGVPIEFEKIYSYRVVQPQIKDEEGNITQEEILDKYLVERRDPGMRENLVTLGTIPRSHKCVRNYTSHALFLYEWAQIGNTVVIVID